LLPLGPGDCLGSSAATICLLLSRARPHVDDPVPAGNHLHIVLHNDDCIAAVTRFCSTSQKDDLHLKGVNQSSALILRDTILIESRVGAALRIRPSGNPTRSVRLWRHNRRGLIFTKLPGYDEVGGRESYASCMPRSRNIDHIYQEPDIPHLFVNVAATTSGSTPRRRITTHETPGTTQTDPRASDSLSSHCCSRHGAVDPRVPFQRAAVRRPGWPRPTD
jgi:hypothetical protein